MTAAQSTPAAAAGAAEPAAPPCVWSAVLARYQEAQEQQASSSIETNTELLEDGGVTFILKIAAKLRDKPKPPAPRLVCGGWATCLAHKTASSSFGSPHSCSFFMPCPY